MNNLDKIFDNTVKNNFKFSAVDLSVMISDKSAADLCGSADFEKLSDKDLYKYCKKVGFNARKWHRRFIAALPEVARRRLYKKYGYCSIYEFAAKMAGVSNDNVYDVIRVSEKLNEMPKIKSLIAKTGLNKVRLVANIAKPETENYWADKIRNMTFSSLRILINEKFRFKTEDEKTVKISQGEGEKGMFDSETFRSQQSNSSTVGLEITQAENLLQTNSNSNSNSNSEIFIKNKKTFTIQIDEETEFELRKFKQKLEKARKEPVDWNSVLKEMVIRASHEKLNEKQVQLKKSQPDEKSASICETRTKFQKFPQNHKSQTNNKLVSCCVPAKIRHRTETKQSKISRYIPAKIKHDLQQKYNGHCAYRGCNKPAEQIHHPKRFAIKPNHENLMPLCREHHDFVHQSTENLIFNRFKSEKFAASG